MKRIIVDYRLDASYVASYTKFVTPGVMIGEGGRDTLPMWTLPIEEIKKMEKKKNFGTRVSNMFIKSDAPARIEKMRTS